MKKFFYTMSLIFLLNGCADTVALLGPSLSGAAGGNITHSSLSTAFTYGVKKQTGKTPAEHALKLAQDYKKIKQTALNQIQPCLEFLEPTDKDSCTSIKKSILKSSKIKSLN